MGTDTEMASVSGYSQDTPRCTHLAHTGRAESHRVLLRRQASHAVSTRVFLRGRAVDEASILPGGASCNRTRGTQRNIFLNGQEKNDVG
ncbi:hypothetical protein N7497_011776 [Penicillium chrysogenum]|jgi:hypothetical protein|nr:hypothetical protein N7497_011776 [Penicillium chrysogenum]